MKMCMVGGESNSYLCINCRPLHSRTEDFGILQCPTYPAEHLAWFGKYCGKKHEFISERSVFKSLVVFIMGLIGQFLHRYHRLNNNSSFLKIVENIK